MSDSISFQYIRMNIVPLRNNVWFQTILYSIWLIDLGDPFQSQFSYHMQILSLSYRNGRPGSSSITDKFKIDWGTYMSSRNDVIYIRLDVRGSKGQSKQALYRHLGGAEVEDQIDALR